MRQLQISWGVPSLLSAEQGAVGHRGRSQSLSAGDRRGDAGFATLIERWRSCEMGMLRIRYFIGTVAILHVSGLSSLGHEFYSTYEESIHCKRYISKEGRQLPPKPRSGSARSARPRVAVGTLVTGFRYGFQFKELHRLFLLVESTHGCINFSVGWPIPFYYICITRLNIIYILLIVIECVCARLINQKF